MICKRVGLEPSAYLDTYFQECSPELAASSCRPVVLVCPGGGYAFTSDREAEPIALAFAARGFHAAVLRYPVAPHRFPDALCSLARAVAWLREHAEEYHLNASQISTCGFSAGGHLAGSLGVFWNRPFLAEETGLTAEQIRPNRQILCYPAITSGEFAHRGSFENLLGEDADEKTLEQHSLELQVSRDTPPTFLWHTYEDQTVPVENALLMASALRRCGVPMELHIYTAGLHGLALDTYQTQNDAWEEMWGKEFGCSGWVDLAAAWLNRNFQERP